MSKIPIQQTTTGMETTAISLEQPTLVELEAMFAVSGSAHEEESKLTTYSINWTPGTISEYVWEPNCKHHAIPNFSGYKKIKGDGPQFVKVGPGSQYYACFLNGAGRNFYGSHKLQIVEL